MSNMDDTKKNQEEPEIDELTKDRYLKGHEFDGIRELDNKLPRWWVYLFYATIIFSIVYMLGYHVTKWWPLQDEEYKNEMAVQAEIKKLNPEPVIDLSTLVPMTAPADLEAGHEIYKKICSVCHGQKGEGLIGPNFADQYWIHGDSTANTISIKDLYKVVINGVIEKGMLSYKDQLTPTQIQQVLSYILTFQGTNPPNPKPAQGVKYDKIG